jgi:hypothetical protein
LAEGRLPLLDGIDCERASPENNDYPGGDVHGPFATIDQALLSKPFSLAAALQFRKLRVDIAIAALAKKVTTKAKTGMGFLDYDVEIWFKNGKSVRGDQNVADMENYSLDRDRDQEKFCGLAENLVRKEEALKFSESILTLSRMEDSSKLSTVFQSALGR